MNLVLVPSSRAQGLLASLPALYEAPLATVGGGAALRGGVMAVNLADLSQGALVWLLERSAVLTEVERTRAGKFKRLKDRQLWEASRVFLRLLLGDLLGLSPDRVNFECTSLGKPWVHGVSFSLSHTRGLLLLGYEIDYGARGHDLGVDAEWPPSLDTSLELADQMHPREQQRLKALEHLELPEAFARLWCRKEAFLKARGTGLLRDPSLDFVGWEGSPSPPDDLGVPPLFQEIRFPFSPAPFGALCLLPQLPPRH